MQSIARRMVRNVAQDKRTVRRSLANAANPGDLKPSPLIHEYLRFKEKFPGFLPSIQVGKFFESYGQDAHIVCQVLNYRMAYVNQSDRNDMCGYPIQSTQASLALFMKSKVRVALIEQHDFHDDGSPIDRTISKGKQSAIPRKVTRLVTPGTVTDDTMLTTESNYLATIWCPFNSDPEHINQTKSGADSIKSDTMNSFVGLSWFDLSTGEFGCMQDIASNIMRKLLNMQPVELLIPQPLIGSRQDDNIGITLSDTGMKAATAAGLEGFTRSFEWDGGLDSVQTASLPGCLLVGRELSCFTNPLSRDSISDWPKAYRDILDSQSSKPMAQRAAAGLFEYVEFTQLGRWPRLQDTTATAATAAARTMKLDPHALSSLEILRTYGNMRKGSLLSCLDRTLTSYGRRLLEQRLKAPSADLETIRQWQSSVAALVRNEQTLKRMRDDLKQCRYDAQRALQAVVLSSGGQRGIQRQLEAVAHALLAAQRAVEIVDETRLLRDVVEDVSVSATQKQTKEDMEGRDHDLVQVTQRLRLSPELKQLADALSQAILGTAPTPTDSSLTNKSDSDNMVDGRSSDSGKSGSEESKESSSKNNEAEIGVINVEEKENEDNDESDRRIKRGYNAELDKLIALLRTYPFSQIQLAHDYTRYAGLEKSRSVVKAEDLKSTGLRLSLAKGKYANAMKELERNERMDVIENSIAMSSTKVTFKTTRTITLEEERSSAQLKRQVLEDRLYTELVNRVVDAAPELASVVEGLARLDVMMSLAQVAIDNALSQPTVVEEPVLNIKGGRHLVVETMRKLSNGMIVQQAPMFVSNSTELMAGRERQVGNEFINENCADDISETLGWGDSVGNESMDVSSTKDSNNQREIRQWWQAPVADQALMAKAPTPAKNMQRKQVEQGETNVGQLHPSVCLLTGPNMGGKSTYLRQNAHMAVLAQIGSFVPAHTATIGIVDRVFSRVGASDELVADRSTFMVEMEETAEILRSATRHSLVVVDEIGRGTSTRDGLVLAWAVLEDLLAIGCRTLFATHFHVLAEHASLQSISKSCSGAAVSGHTNANNTTVEANHRQLVNTDLPPLRMSGNKLGCWRLGVVKEKLGSLDDDDDRYTDIFYTYTVEPGVAGESYGLHCAALANVPFTTLDRARELRKLLEHR